MEILELNTVPILTNDYEFDKDSSIDDLLLYADGYSVLNTNTIIEGVVFKSNETKDLRELEMFKVISNKFLLKVKD